MAKVSGTSYAISPTSTQTTVSVVSEGGITNLSGTYKSKVMLDKLFQKWNTQGSSAMVTNNDPGKKGFKLLSTSVDPTKPGNLIGWFNPSSPMTLDEAAEYMAEPHNWELYIAPDTELLEVGM